MEHRLFLGVSEDYADERSKKERMKKIRLDSNYNALQIKYAYAITCHKAQGGQWKNVFLDQGWLPADSIDVGYYRWLYTAFTRPTEQLNLLAWPQTQSE
jgi:exodeoxyribonuclease-5